VSASPVPPVLPRPLTLWAIVFAAYAAVLVSLTWARPFWLDELLQLLITRDPNSASRWTMMHQTPGAVPLGYEVQRLIIQWLGYSVFAARLPAEVFSVLALGGVLLAAREIGTRGRGFAALVWAMVPLLLRYAVEARPYSQSLFLSAAATALLFRIGREPKARWVALYALCITAGLYTQPYSLFLQAGLAAPLLFRQRDPGARRAFWLGSACLAGGVLLFAPWVLSSARGWTEYAHSMEETLVLPGKLPLLLVREISGGSYVCSLSLLAFAAAGCASRRLGGLAKRQLLAGAAACVLLALACDTVFGYFFAIRQVISALVPLCLLAGEGWAEAGDRWGRYPRLALLVPLVAASLVKDVRQFRDRSEDWQLAARQLERASASGCVLYLHADLPGLYEFFAPELRARACEPVHSAANVFVPVTRYSIAEEVRRTDGSLAALGYRPGGSYRESELLEIRRYVRSGS